MNPDHLWAGGIRSSWPSPLWLLSGQELLGVA